ncbi:aquaporin-like protein [Lophium mytilinum]|uniref:Aquaporin-like protein n=1 Tax=Lophium mytilinum TaxID=390894 RepID=A0A6A6QNW6_9PEZI|nr:aquaporin-like protein [Lophium mytilinum]
MHRDNALSPIEGSDVGGEIPTRTSSQRGPAEIQRWGGYSDGGRRSDDYGYRGYYPDRRRTTDGPYYPDHWTPPREPYPDYFEEERRPPPRAYRRGAGHSRPPPTHRNYRSERYTEGPPSGGPKVHYESDYGSEDEYPPQRPTLSNMAATLAKGGNGGRPPSAEAILRIPWTAWMNSRLKNHFVAFIGEFVGTTMFLFFAFAGTQVANIGSGNGAGNTTTGGDTGFNVQVLLYISVVFGFSLMVNVWVFFRISGGLFNPAVSLAMLMTKAMSMTRCTILVVAQLAGSIFASYLVSVMFPTPLNVRTTLSTDTSIARGIFIEAVLTAELVFTIFMLAKEKHRATFIAPVGIGLALFVAELVGVFYTGGSLNPARSFGPCVVTGIFDKEHWIYWVGPGIGAVIAVAFYKVIKVLEYEMANPGQDDDGGEDLEAAMAHSTKERAR